MNDRELRRHIWRIAQIPEHIRRARKKGQKERIKPFQDELKRRKAIMVQAGLDHLLGKKDSKKK